MSVDEIQALIWTVVGAICVILLVWGFVKD